ncbi:MAG TPA: hypothetical protein VMD59_20330 [Acidimicrobiales bacterium]|nr:hypothetical protein [Acidimicrobiales bacterium]
MPGEGRSGRRQRRLGLPAVAALLGAAFLVTVTAGSTSAAPKPPGWPEKLISQAGFSDLPVLLPGTRYAYGIVPAPGSSTSGPTGPAATSVFGQLDQINLANGSVNGGQVVFSGAALFETGTTIGVLEPSSESVSADGQATATQPPTSQILRTIVGNGVLLRRGNVVPALGDSGSGEVLATTSSSGAGGLWVATAAPAANSATTTAADGHGTHGHARSPAPPPAKAGDLLLVDPTTGVLIRRFPAPSSPIDDVMASPSGAQLYVAGPLSNAPGQPWAIWCLDAANGRVLARAQLPIGDQPTLSATTDSGVWVTDNVGFTSSSELLTLPGLHAVVPGLVKVVQAKHSGSAYTVIFGSTAFSIGQFTVACGSPSGALYTQQPLGYLDGNQERYEPFALYHGTLFAIGLPNDGPPSGIIAITPTGCRV